MRIVGLKLTNFRIFRELEWSFGEQDLVVFIGENGGGKSAVLDALGIGIKAVLDLAQCQTDRPIYITPLKETDVSVDEVQCEIDLKLEFDDGSTGVMHASFVKFDFIPRYHYSGDIEQLQLKEILMSINPYDLPIFLYFPISKQTTKENRENLDKGATNRIHALYVDVLQSNTLTYKSFQDWFAYQDIIELQEKAQKKNYDVTIPSLQAVRNGVNKFLSQIMNTPFGAIIVKRDNLRLEDGYTVVSKNLGGNLYISKNDLTIRLDNLSSGEKRIVLIAAEIIRRLFIAKSITTNVLNRQGIVLIDEIELHLHPAWQRRILPALRATFPNVQFFVTTHSPQTLSTLNREQIIEVRDGELFSASADPKGRDTNGILEELMGVDKRPEEVDDLIDEIMEGIYSEQPDFAAAEAKIERLKSLVATGDPILLRIDSVIRRRKALA